jgi:hypothetical protein
VLYEGHSSDARHYFKQGDYPRAAEFYRKAGREEEAKALEKRAEDIQARHPR